MNEKDNICKKMLRIVELNFVQLKNNRKSFDLVKIKEIPGCVEYSYNDFFNNYIVQNIPCIIKNVTSNWKCSSKWVQDCKPNIEYLLSKYHNSLVSISNCTSSESDNYNCKKSVSFKEYIDEYYSSECIWYLKDWHLKNEFPEESFYSVPEYFASDWLNEYAVDNKFDDFMFVYLGPKGSWTPFHADVYSSFSWSANVVGKKRWILFPPGEEKQFIDKYGNLPQDIQPYLNTDNLNYFDIVQNPGDAIFVPSEWYHQVFNLEDTISINHNWVNGSNISIMWDALATNMLMVEKEIEEFQGPDEWKDHCQTMLKALFGLNYRDFFELVMHLAKKRLLYHENEISFENWKFGENHILFDLNAIQSILKIMIKDSHFNESELLAMNIMIDEINELFL